MDPIPKILIVDDDTVVAASVKAVLSRREYDIIVTNDALEGVELLHQKEFDLAILDVMMPVMSGFEIIESVKDLNLDTLFMIMTGDTSMDSAIKAIRKGASDYIRKPFDADELMIRVENAIRHKRSKDEKRLIQSEKKQLELQLRQSQKMEAIGTLAGGMAHDFNNTLGIIIGNTELAISTTPKDSPNRQYLNNIITASCRAEEMVSRLLSFSRITDAEKKPIDLISSVDESLKLLRSSLPSDIEIKKNLPDSQLVILGDPTQLNQVMVNLCTNAAHAMNGSGGMLEINMSTRVIGLDPLTSFNGLPQGHYAEITISDTGHGISEDVIKRVFDPYFTTKETGKGTGMGLAVVHGIVKNHGGAIKVESEINEGTVFTIYIPLIDAVIDNKPAVDVEHLPGGKESILLVDDEYMIADTMKIMMEQLGYRVKAFTESSRALEVFESNPDAFDLVITDMTMPRMTGDLLASKIQDIREDTPVIICTGFNNRVDPDGLRNKGICEILNKPVRTTTLAKAIKDVLNARSKDRRQDERFATNEDIFVVSSTKPEKKHSLLDISRSGMAFKYYSIKNQMVENGKYSIMTSDKRFVLEDIFCKTVSDTVLNHSNDLMDVSVRRRGIQFKDLTLSQYESLGFLLDNYTKAAINA
ncbi:MAG: response regulator [Desulfobacteraceae bacterium]